MSTTSAYGWNIPDNTDLVKDGALAIRTLGNAIDTSMNTALGTKKAGMVLLNTTSFSGVVSQRVNPFSATYDNYRIIIQLTSGAGAGDLELRLASGASVLSGSNYSFAYFVKQIGAAALSGGSNTSATVWLAGGVANTSTSGDLTLLEIGNPFKTAYTTYSATSTRLDDYVWTVGGKVNLTTSYDGFQIANSSSTNIAGTISVYGYNK
jgi:hypothetical protein